MSNSLSRILLVSAACWVTACSSEAPDFDKGPAGAELDVPDAGGVGADDVMSSEGTGERESGTSNGQPSDNRDASSVGSDDSSAVSSNDVGSNAMAGGKGDDNGSEPSLGDDCSAGSDCASGHCADGYCCDEACDGQCESCSEAGMEGSCVPVSGEPRGARDACDGNGACQGQCDGVDGRVCDMPDSDTVCEAASCAEGVVTAESVCNGAGTCTEANTSECASAACDAAGSVCEGSCSASSCGSDRYCDPSGACFDKLVNGETCSSTEQCASGNCVDGICCDTACAGLCESCAEPGSAGTCQVLTGDPLPARGACDGSGVCQGQCDGESGGACAYPGNSTECSPAACSGGEATPAAQCDGAGSCSTPMPSSCESGLCDGAACSGSCTQASCGVGSYCATSGACAPVKSLGQSCGGGAECEGGNCVDGVCCGSACTGQCQMCNSSGACVRNTGAPLGGRAACNGAGTDCQGFCDGSSDNCVYPDSETVCQDMTCSMDLGSVSYRTCNGAGTCSMNESDACSASTYCGGSSCISKKSDNNSCDLAIECSSGNCAADPSAGSMCCASGRANCDGACVNLDTNDAHCGSCGDACGANEACQSGNCQCEGTALSCGGCGSWTFESGNAEGWLEEIPPRLGGGVASGVENIRAATDPVGSSGVLAVDMVGGNGTVSWAKKVCVSGSAAVQDMTFTANIYIDVSSGSFAFERYLHLEAWDTGTGQSFNTPLFGINWNSPDGWVQVQGTISLSTATHVGFYLGGTGDAVATFYLDNISIE